MNPFFWYLFIYFLFSFIFDIDSIFSFWPIMHQFNYILLFIYNF